jgi:hypothetical protein
MLAICLVISAIATVVMVVSAIINPETASIPTITASGVVPLALIASLLASKEDEKA